jgi:hypothetical protein
MIAGQQRDHEVVASIKAFQRVRAVANVMGIDVLLSDESFNFCSLHHFGGELVSKNELVTLLGPILIGRFSDFIKAVCYLGRLADVLVAR